MKRKLTFLVQSIFMIKPFKINLKSFKVENKDTRLTFRAKFSNFKFKCFVWFRTKLWCPYKKNFFLVDSLTLKTKTAFNYHFQIFPITKKERKWPVESRLPLNQPFQLNSFEKALVFYLNFNNNIFTVEFLCAIFFSLYLLYIIY